MSFLPRVCIFLWTTTSIAVTHAHNETDHSTTALLASDIDNIGTLPATNMGSNLYQSSSSDSETGPSSTGIALLIAGGILVIFGIFIVRICLAYHEQQKLRSNPTLWDRTKSLSLTNITSLTSAGSSSQSVNSVKSAMSTDIAPDKQQQLNEIWNESEQTIHEIDINFDGDGVEVETVTVAGAAGAQSPSQSIGYIEAIVASQCSGDEVEESKTMTFEAPKSRQIASQASNHSNDSKETNLTMTTTKGIEDGWSSTKREPDPRDDPNWRSPTKQYRITVHNIDDLDDPNLGVNYYDEPEAAPTTDRVPHRMVAVNSRSVSEYAEMDYDDHIELDIEHDISGVLDDLDQRIQRIDEEIGNTFQRTPPPAGDHCDEMDSDPDICYDDVHHRNDTMETIDTIVVMEAMDDEPVTPPLPTEDFEESVHGFEAEESIEESDSDNERDQYVD